MTPDEWRSHLDQLFADPAFRAGSRWLIDLDTADDMAGITNEVIVDMGKRLNAQAEILHDMQVGIVPNGAWERAQQLIDREVSVAGLRAILFNDLSIASAWLGLLATDVRSILGDIRAELRRASIGPDAT